MVDLYAMTRTVGLCDPAELAIVVRVKDDRPHVIEICNNWSGAVVELRVGTSLPRFVTLNPGLDARKLGWAEVPELRVESK